jgi:hypothetical protein
VLPEIITLRVVLSPAGIRFCLSVLISAAYAALYAIRIKITAVSILPVFFKKSLPIAIPFLPSYRFIFHRFQHIFNLGAALLIISFFLFIFFLAGAGVLLPVSSAVVIFILLLIILWFFF